ncbi:MAG: hypothetical protein R3D67_00805 [Hyphomicrobiaceae bacterium]
MEFISIEIQPKSRIETTLDISQPIDLRLLPYRVTLWRNTRYMGFLLMDPKIIAAGATAFLLAAVFMGPLKSAPPDFHTAQWNEMSRPSNMEFEQQVSEVRKNAEDKANRRQAEFKRRLKEIEDESAIRQANLQRRLKEIDYDHQRSIWNMEAEDRARQERQRQADQDDRVARISRDNAYLASQRERTQKERDRNYREQERLRTGRRY